MSKAPIIPVLEHYGAEPLRETEHWRPVKCPFHEDHNASASYIAGENGQAFNCHGCSVKGDAISLIRERESLDYKEAVKLLEQIVGQGLGLVKDTAPKKYRPIRITGESRGEEPPPRRRRKPLRIREE